MKTTVKMVTVELLIDGKKEFRSYSIATKNGILMTHRLEKLLKGNTIRNHEERLDAHYGEWHDVRFVCMVWKPPYRLLQELTENRVELQRELYKMEGYSDLTAIPVDYIPDKAPDELVTELMLGELRTRKLIKARLRELDQSKEAKDARMPDEPSGPLCTGWLLDDTCISKPYSW